MSLFDTDIIERNICVRQVYDIHIDFFSPDLFYKWIWKEKGVEYPPRYPQVEGVPTQLLRNIFMDKLGEISADDFIKWEEIFVKSGSIKHFRRYFKKLIKREYMSKFTVYFDFDGKNIHVGVPYEGLFGQFVQMTIKFHRK